MDTSSDLIKQNVPNRYSLVVLAAKRAKQLKEGAPILIQTESTNSLTIALEEIAAGKINYIEAAEPVDDEAAGAALTAAAPAQSSQPTAMQMLEESLAEAERAANFTEPEQALEAENDEESEDADTETEAEAGMDDAGGATPSASEEE